MTAGNNSRHFKDPERTNVGKWCNPSTAELGRDGFWSEAGRQEQDAAFRLAVTTALESGLETCPTSPSTHFGTRAPIVGYQRD